MLRHQVVIALTALALAGCAQTRSPKEVAESYLTAVQSADLAKAAESYCLPGEINSSPMVSANRWEIVSEEEAAYEGIPYTKITARVDSSGVGGESSKNWDLWVMTPDNSYAQAEAINKQLASMGGRPVALDRSEWSDEDLCVSIPQ